MTDTPTPDASTDRDTSTETETTDTIRDPDEYVTERRLQAIFDIRNQLHSSRKRVKVARQDSTIPTYEAASGYRSIVESYILEVEPLLRRYQPGPTILKERDFATIEVMPQVKTRQAPRGRTVEKVRVADDPTINGEWVEISNNISPTKIPVEGLETLLQLPDPLTAEYKLNISNTWRGATTEHYTATAQIDFETLDLAVRSVNEFLAKIGFEIDPEETDTLSL